MLNPEYEFDHLLTAWAAAEERIVYLYELDPTHVAAQPAQQRGTQVQTSPEYRPSLPFCLFGESAPAAVLLELDPVHLHRHRSSLAQDCHAELAA
jgi:hypothetical protein